MSTEDQALEGYSINAQIEKLAKYADINDWDIYDIYTDDGRSGKNITGRPELQRLLKDVEEGRIDNVLVYKLDRLTRSLIDLMEMINFFEKYDCSLNSHTEKLDTSNAVGRMFVKILGTFAEFERENLAERVAFGYEQKTREGNYTNTNGVFGYDYIRATKTEDGKLVVNPQEAPIVNQIYDWYISGYSMLKITKLLKDMGVPTKRGGKWSQTTIRSILTNPLYVGIVRYSVKSKKSGKYFETDGKAIIPILTMEKFEEAQHCMKKRQNFNTRRYPSEKAYYSRVLKCSKCGGTMYARQQVQGKGHYISYSCNNARNGECDAVGFSHFKMNTAFGRYLEKLDELNPPKNFAIEAPVNDDGQGQRKKLNSALKRIEAKKIEARKLFISDGLPSDEYKKIVEELDKKKTGIDKELMELESVTEKESFNVADLQRVVSDVKLNWEHLTDKERQRFMELFVQYISVEKENEEVIIKGVCFDTYTPTEQNRLVA